MSTLTYGAQRALAEKTRLGRTATTRTCKTCAQPTLIGLDDDACAFTVTVDPYPITARDEIRAAIAGKKTFLFSASKSRVDFRTPARIISAPIEVGVIVLIEHECWTHPIGDTSKDVTAPSRAHFYSDNPPY